VGSSRGEIITQVATKNAPLTEDSVSSRSIRNSLIPNRCHLRLLHLSSLGLVFICHDIDGGDCGKYHRNIRM